MKNIIFSITLLLLSSNVGYGQLRPNDCNNWEGFCLSKSLQKCMDFQYAGDKKILNATSKSDSCVAFKLYVEHCDCLLKDLDYFKNLDGYTHISPNSGLVFLVKKNLTEENYKEAKKEFNNEINRLCNNTSNTSNQPQSAHGQSRGSDPCKECPERGSQSTTQVSVTEEMEQRRAEQRALVVLEIQSMHSAEQQNRREYYQEQLEGWKKDMAKYNGASFGSEVSDSYYEEKHTDSKASASVQERLQNYKLDDDEFTPGDMPVSEPDNMFVRVSEEELKRRLEQAKEESKKERDEKQTQMCLQAEDDYVSRLPPALRVDSWNYPVDKVSTFEFIRKNGEVLYQADGVVFTYLIYRAIHKSGLSYKVCSVDPSSYRHSKDRSLSNDGRVFYWYNLYYILENKSDTTTVTFQRFPSIEISMTGESSWGLCDEWLCAGSEGFGNDAKLNIVASPHIMEPNSIVWEFEGAWYPADRPAPQLSEWVVGRFYTQPFKK